MLRVAEHELDPRARGLLRARVEARDDRSIGEDAAYRAASASAASLPQTLLAALLTFREGRQHALLLRNLPLGAVSDMPTPLDPVRAPRNVFGFQLMCLSIATVMGTPFAYSTQQGGRLINNIAPSPEADDQANIGVGSALPFGFHTEDAFMPHPPSYLQLACIRNPSKTGTILSPMPETLDIESENSLRENVFHVGTNPAQSAWGDAFEGPLFYGPRHRACLRYNESNTAVGALGGARHSKALVTLGNLVVSQRQEVITEPGDILLVNNEITCHARSAFPARFDGTDRWLQRIVAYRDPRSIADFTVMRDYPTIGRE